MSFGFLNVAMLLGTAAVVLPVIAHLLSKRRYDVVHWGAMRFLQLGKKTRRRIRIQDILLLLLRMGLIALVALALARPWGQGSLMGHIRTQDARDLVIVLDSSASMAWQGNQDTPHQAAIDWIHEALETLGPSDTVALIDARSQPRKLIDPPTSNFSLVRKELADLPDPSGTSNLPGAITEAIKILMTGTNLTREVIVLTDRQALPWHAGDEFAWERIDDLVSQPEVTPRIRVVDLTDEPGDPTNISVGRIELSREVTVPNFPIRLRATLQQSGGANVQKNVFFEINGQRVDLMTKEVNLLPDGEALVEFERVFTKTGKYIIRISTEEDDLPTDNASEAVVLVENGIPVLLVDGTPNVDVTKSETFFARSVFAASGDVSPWVNATVVAARDFNADSLKGQKVVFLCNVPRLTDPQKQALSEYVAGGGGLVIAPGDQVEPANWNQLAEVAGVRFLPAEFESIDAEAPKAADSVTIDSLSLKLPWLRRFRKESGIDFCTARFSKWWKLNPQAAAVPDDAEENETTSRPMIIANLSTGSPLIVTGTFGDGTIMQLATALDADWSTLPAKSDFVPFLHELVFLLSSSDMTRNVGVGSPLVLPLSEADVIDDFTVTGPGIEDESVIRNNDAATPQVMFTETYLPGIYEFKNANGTSEPFAVSDDREESDLTPLTDADWEILATDERLETIEDVDQLIALRDDESSRTELWWLLLALVLLMLVAEVALTRNMVKGGHHAMDPVAT